MTEKCHYCSEPVSQLGFVVGEVVKIGRDRYAHTDCIDSHGKENTMEDQTQHILRAADSAHQGIGVAISLLQEAMGNMGEILTQGCVVLGPASLGSAMRLGQSIKESRFLLDTILQGAHGLCVLLGEDLGVCKGETETLGGMVGEPLGTPDFRDLMDTLDSEDLGPGEDEYDDDEQPF